MNNYIRTSDHSTFNALWAIPTSTLSEPRVHRKPEYLYLALIQLPFRKYIFCVEYKYPWVDTEWVYS